MSKQQSVKSLTPILALFFNEQSDLHKASQILGVYFKKDKPPFRLVFVTNNEKAVSMLAEQKTIDKLIKENDADVFISSSKSIVNALGQVADKYSDYHIIYSNICQLDNLKSLLANIQTCNSVNANCFHIIQPIKKSKAPFANKFNALFTNLWNHTNVSDFSNVFLIFKAEYIKHLADSFEFKASSFSKSIAELLVFHHYNEGNSKIIEDEFLHITKSEQGVIGTKLNAFALAFRTRFQWHVQLPIKLSKQKDLLGTEKFSYPLYRLLFFVLALVSMFALPILSLGFGMSWDEPDNLRYAKDILNFYLSFGEDESVFDLNKPVYSHMINYGLFFDTFTVMVQSVSPIGEYETRHMLNAFTGWLAIVFVGMCAREAAGWRAALAALIFMLFSPYFIGHAMNNPKDIPFATGFIMSMYFMIRYLKQLPTVKPATLWFLTFSIAYVISIRIGGLLVTAFFGLFTALAWIVQLYQRGTPAFKFIPKYTYYVLIVAVASYFIGILPWPYGIIKPFENPFIALQSFTQFSNVTIYEIFDGERMYMNEVPWYYIPKHIFYGTPLYILAGLLLSPLLLFSRKIVHVSVAYLLLFVVVFSIAYAAIGGSTLYNGWRHFLFVYPPLVVVGAVNLEILMRLVKKPILQLAIILVVVAGITKTTYWMIDNHPNEYCYYNELIGGYSGAYSYYETDTYGNAMRQGVEWLIKNVPEVTQKKTVVAVNMTPPTGQYYADRLTDSVQCQWVRDYERFKANWDYAIFAPRTYSPTELRSGAYPHKETFHIIYVEDKPLLSILKRQNSFMPDGYAKTETGDWAGAIADFEKAVEYDELNEEAWRMLGFSYLNTSQDEKAKTAFEKAIEISPESQNAIGYLGFYYAKKADFQNAIKMYELSIAKKVNYTFGYAQLGFLHNQLKNHREALLYFYKYLIVQTTDMGTLARLSKESDLRKYEQAVIITTNSDANILYNMGVAYYQLANNDLALKYFGYTKELNPNNADAFQNLGVVLSNMGRGDEAQQYLQRAKELRGY